MADKTSRSVPPEQWTVEKPFDSSDYLDGEPPTYEEVPEGVPLEGDEGPEPEPFGEFTPGQEETGGG